MSRPYKDHHEAFVSNLKGTSAADVLICLSYVPVAVILLKLVQKSSLPLYLRDVAYLVVPILLNLTILADFSYITLFALLLCELYTLQKILQISLRGSNISDDIFYYSAENNSLLKSKTSFISLFRGKIEPTRFLNNRYKFHAYKMYLLNVFVKKLKMFL